MVSRYILAKYSPKMPRANSCKPPISRMMQIRLGQPATGSPNRIARTATKIIPKNAPRQHRSPEMEANTSGAVEKPTIPSIEYLNSDQKFHLVFLLPFEYFHRKSNGS